jgi:hypothetical protein
MDKNGILFEYDVAKNAAIVLPIISCPFYIEE